MTWQRWKKPPHNLIYGSRRRLIEGGGWKVVLATVTPSVAIITQQVGGGCSRSQMMHINTTASTHTHTHKHRCRHTHTHCVPSGALSGLLFAFIEHGGGSPLSVNNVGLKSFHTTLLGHVS